MGFLNTFFKTLFGRNRPNSSVFNKSLSPKHNSALPFKSEPFYALQGSLCHQAIFDLHGKAANDQAYGVTLPLLTLESLVTSLQKSLTALSAPIRPSTEPLLIPSFLPSYQRHCNLNDKNPRLKPLQPTASPLEAPPEAPVPLLLNALRNHFQAAKNQNPVPSPLKIRHSLKA